MKDWVESGSRTGVIGGYGGGEGGCVRGLFREGANHYHGKERTRRFPYEGTNQ